MAITQKDLPYPNAGDRPSHKDITRLSDALTYLSRQVGGQTVEWGAGQRGAWIAIEQFLGLITSDDAPDAMYYVNRAALSSDYDASGLVASVPDKMFPGKVLATNLAELTFDTPPVARTDITVLDAGQQVQVTRWMSRADVTEEGGKLTVKGAKFVYTFTFGGAGGPPQLWIKITGSSSIGDNRWSYAWAEQTYQQAGQWQDTPDGRTSGTDGPAFNTIEANNTGSGVQGNSVDVDDLPTGFDLSPVAGGPVVLAHSVVNCNGVSEILFSYENGVTGTCT